MPLLTRYSHLKKKNEKGKFVPFHAVRVVGMAVEKGHKVARDRGLGSVKEADLGKVLVAGKLLACLNGTWKGIHRCDLSLQPQDAKLSLVVVHQQRTYLADLGFSAYRLDVNLQREVGATLDMVGDFVPSRANVPGKVWVELKVGGLHDVSHFLCLGCWPRVST